MRVFILVLSTMFLFSCENIVKNGSVFDVNGIIEGKEYSTVKDIKIEADVYYVVTDSKNSEAKVKSISAKGELRDGVIETVFDFNIDTNADEEIKILKISKIVAEVDNDNLTDVFLGENFKAHKTSEYFYKINVKLAYFKTVEKNAKMEQLKRCYREFKVSMGSQAAYNRCRELIYGY